MNANTPVFTVRQNLQPANFDFIVTSIDYLGTPGNLNRMVMQVCGYHVKLLPNELQLKSGFYLLSNEGRKPILFIVTLTESDPRETLQHNLYNGLLTYKADLSGKSVWLPIMGTGAAEMDFETSYGIMTSVLERLHFQEMDQPPAISISVSKSVEGDRLMQSLGLPLFEELNAEDSVVEEGRSGFPYSFPFSFPEDSADEDGRKWLLKMGQSWDKEDWKLNETIVFQPKDYQGNPVSDAIPEDIKAGDKVLGFLAGKRDYVFAVFQVESAPDKAYGAPNVRLMVEGIFTPPIPLHKFKELAAGKMALKSSSLNEEYFYILAEEYQYILDQAEVPFVNDYLPFYLTEGDHKSTEDQLDFKSDIDSLGTVICLEAMKPPLAIGLFGNWGSGKSFFMEKLEEKIAQITKFGEPGYVKNVVSVRFNSWHYSDANLWASMITQIFESMNAFANNIPTGAGAMKELYRKLNMTSAQIAITEQKIAESDALQKSIEVKKISLELEATEQKNALRLWQKSELFQMVFDDPAIRSELQDINAKFKNEQLDANVDQLRTRLAEVGGLADRIREGWVFIKQRKKSQLFWFCVAILVLAVIAFVLMIIFQEEIHAFIGGLQTVSAVALASITGIIAMLAPGFKNAGKLYDYLKNFVQRVEAQKSRKELARDQKVQELSDSLVSMQAARMALDAEKALAVAQQKLWEKELSDIGSGRSLADFLSDKAIDNNYLSKLGIISWIRKDFEQLNTILVNQKGMISDVGDPAHSIKIDRIVLYIDDLDRCNEEVVVQVLEAIHLLLAFPLFVVVVGVDPRWLNNALKLKYKSLFGGSGANAEDDAKDQMYQEAIAGVASSYDYLEKIFQIPFALKPINKKGREDLIKYLLKDELKADSPQKERKAVGSKERKMDEGAGKDESDEQAHRQDASEEKNDDANKQFGVPVLETDPKIQQPTIVKRRLEITEEELAYMQHIAPLFGNTPRTINRYVNIYRIIKAHGSLVVNGPYERDEFLPIMFVLAVIVGFAAQAESFLEKIRKAKDDQNCADFIAGCGIENLRKTATPLLDKLATMDMKYMKQNLELISRFSFRTLMKEAME